MDIDFDLTNLDDSFFDVHEVVFKDENELFRLSTFVDTVVKSNPKAQSEGVFRGRLARRKPDLKVASWETFDLNASGGHLVAQFLITPDHPQCFVMEHRIIELTKKQTAFSKAVFSPGTFQTPKPNCCTEALNQGGPKLAVKHFYEALRSRATVIPKWHEPTSDYSVNKKKARYEDRQSTLQSQDPFTTCALIEKSMKSKAYEVKGSSQETGNGINCQCHMCHMHEQSEKIICEPLALKKDGEGDNCSLYYTGIEESEGNLLYITPNFALAHLCHLNMLTDLDSYYPGISFPFIYLGGLHSFFPIHIEDMSLWSINYHHAGHPKLWIIVAPCHVSKLSQLLSLYGLHNLHRVCMFKLSHKSTVVFPQFLLHHKINFKIVIQQPGDFIFLAPNAAHTGGNMGETFSQACNIGTPDWLPYGSVASIQDCRCLEDKIHMDVTSLIRIHRKDLLEHHLNKSMHKNYKDGHFEKSIIIMSTDARQADNELVPSHSMLECSASSLAKPNSSTKAVKASCKAPISCPIQNCFTEYKVPNKRTLLQHINTQHPEKASSKKLLQAVDSLFPKKGSLRRTCEDCGSDISVYSNKHKGSAKCLSNQEKKG